MLITALLQLRGEAPAHVGHLARWSLLGFVLLLGGLLAEWQWGVEFGIVRGAVLVPALWRLALHAGVGVLLWQGIRFFWVRAVTSGWISSAHGLLIAVAGLAMVVVMMAWRVVGAFPPWFQW